MRVRTWALPVCCVVLAAAPAPAQGPGVITETVVAGYHPYSGSSTTIISGVRNGVGNQLIVTQGGSHVEIVSPPAAYGTAFDWRDFVPMDRTWLDWNRRHWSRSLGCWLYLSPNDPCWYWYDAARLTYRPWYVHPGYGW